MLLLRRQRRAASASCTDLQSRKLHADAGVARVGQTAVADEPQREAREDRRQGRAPWPLRYFFGDDEGELCNHANAVDDTTKAKFKDWIGAPCSDGFAFTSPVASFKPNAFGLFDVSGNVASWTEDCDSDNYNSTPTDGSLRTSPDCTFRVLRGGSWNSDPRFVRAATRLRHKPGSRTTYIGFRVARTLP